ncbi:hypothetical protein [Amycolatopsis circi]|uniref:hypothetical protein n=1 Tax=Amycolatopsis circi TaxID=871959 RepID=UPI0013BEAB2C|nr:hypothetical protein [Amycolatopsis circi]
MINQSIFEAENPNLKDLPDSVAKCLESSVPQAPEAGQLWRISWGNLPPRLGVVARSNSSYVHVLPVTLDVMQRVDAAVVVESTPLAIPLVVWPQLRTGLGDFVLAEFLGQLFDPSEVNKLVKASGEMNSQDLISVNVGLSPAMVESRRGYRDNLAREFARLCDSDWHRTDSSGVGDYFVSSEMASSAGFTVADLADLLEVSKVEGYSIFRSERPIPIDGLGKLEDALRDHFKEVVVERPVNVEARTALDSPDLRRAIERAAVETDVAEDELRRDLYSELISAPRRESSRAEAVDRYRSALRMMLIDRLQEGS